MLSQIFTLVDIKLLLNPFFLITSVAPSEKRMMYKQIDKKLMFHLKKNKKILKCTVMKCKITC